jgi:hypothetical protein
MCRRPHGAAFVTWTAVPPKQLKITAGEAQLTRFESDPRRVCAGFAVTVAANYFAMWKKM